MYPCALLSLVLACASSDDTGDVGLLVTDQGFYALDVSMTPDPPVADATTLTVVLTTADSGEPELGATLAVTPWMPDHGHGISEPPTVTEDSGSYTVEFVYSMPGSWELTFDVDGSLGPDSAVLAVEVQ